MAEKLEIGGLHCLCGSNLVKDRIAYVLYPMDILDEWIDSESERYDTTIVVITGMEWQDALSPWHARGVPSGSPDFKGDAPEFLRLLQKEVIPAVESALGFDGIPQRTLVGVSMSGLFALWQWLECGTFRNIASLSGSFWYEGFVEWVRSCTIPKKEGMAYFLLGDREAHSKVKAFDSVADDTAAIISLLEGHGIKTEFQSVPGNHYSDPIPRLEKAFTAIFK